LLAAGLAEPSSLLSLSSPQDEESELDSSDDSPTALGLWYMQQTVILSDVLDVEASSCDIPLEDFLPIPSLFTTSSAHCTLRLAGLDDEDDEESCEDDSASARNTSLPLAGVATGPASAAASVGPAVIVIVAVAPIARVLRASGGCTFMLSGGEMGRLSHW